MKSDNIVSGVRWQIFIEGLYLMTYVGLHAHEYHQQQAVELDIEMSYRPGRKDNKSSEQADPDDQTESIIDYDKYCTLLSTFMQYKPHTCLLETLASEVASLSFRDYPMLEEIKVAIHKPKIRENAARLGVSACWTRWSYETLLVQQPQETVLNA